MKTLFIFVEILKLIDMEVEVKEGNMTTLEIGQLGKEVIHVIVGHFVWSQEEKAKFVRSEKMKEVADKIEELLKTIEL